MKSLALMWRGAKKRGRPVTIPFQPLADIVEFHTGQLAVLAGGPGGGKSLLATNWVNRSTDNILYVALDDATSIRNRLSALALGRSARDFHSGDADYWFERLDAREKGNLFITEGVQTVESIEANIIASHEFWGEYPTLVIIDNLKDIHMEGSNQGETGFYTVIVPALKDLAAKYDVAILGLHHVLRRGGEKGKDYGDGTTPLNLTSLLFGGERDAALVLGVYQTYNRDGIYVQILKQRDGEADAKGFLKVRLDWNPDTGTLWSR